MDARPRWIPGLALVLVLLLGVACNSGRTAAATPARTAAPTTAAKGPATSAPVSATAAIAVTATAQVPAPTTPTAETSAAAAATAAPSAAAAAPAAGATAVGATAAGTTAAQPPADKLPAPKLGDTFQPLDQATCSALANAMSQGFKLQAQTGQEPFEDFISGGTGTGCEAHVTGTGATFKSLGAAARVLQGIFTGQGWKQDNQYQADGPNGTLSGYLKGGAVCLAGVNWQPAAGTNCPQDQPLSACPLKPEEQNYTVSINCAQPVARGKTTPAAAAQPTAGAQPTVAAPLQPTQAAPAQPTQAAKPAPSAPAPTQTQATKNTWLPLNPATCSQLSRAVTKTLNMPGQLAPADFEDMIAKSRGTGCQTTVQGTGANFQGVYQVVAPLARALGAQGWMKDQRYEAGGLTGQVSGYRKGKDLCLLSAQWAPAAGTSCPQDQPISACNLKPEQRAYTITLNCAQPAAR